MVRHRPEPGSRRDSPIRPGRRGRGPRALPVRCRQGSGLALLQATDPRPRRSTRATDSNPILIEETAIEILSLLVAVAYTGVDRVETMPTDCGRDLAEATKQVLAKRYLHPISLRLLAVEVGASVFHLCRTFRKFHGTTVHRYLVEMRLRRALEELARERTDLGGLAVALKFSHHSHFSAAFRSEFGVPPSVARSGPAWDERRDSAEDRQATSREVRRLLF